MIQSPANAQSTAIQRQLTPFRRRENSSSGLFFSFFVLCSSQSPPAAKITAAASKTHSQKTIGHLVENFGFGSENDPQCSKFLPQLGRIQMEYNALHPFVDCAFHIDGGIVDKNALVCF